MLLLPLRDRLAPERLLPLLLLREDADLAAPDERLEPVPDDFARDELDLLPPLLAFVPPLAERELLLRDFDAPLAALEPLLPEEPEDFEARDEDPERFAPEDDELRPLVDLPELLRDEAEPEPPPSLDHLPLITRCAASATASAMIEPNLVALDSMLPAARSAVSAASRPASRIFLRAAGLALIAAAAAARPAASISLLIAAFASLSTVSLPEPEDPEELEPEELLRADLAICGLPPLLRGKTLQSRSGSLMKSEVAQCR